MGTKDPFNHSFNHSLVPFFILFLVLLLINCTIFFNAKNEKVYISQATIYHFEGNAIPYLLIIHSSPFGELGYF